MSPTNHVEYGWFRGVLRRPNAGTRGAMGIIMVTHFLPSTDASVTSLSATDSRASPSGTLLHILKQWRMNTVFTVPGGPLMPLLEVCPTAGFNIVVCRQETNAVIMAASYYHATGIPAVVALTSGPGAANAVNGCMFALREHAAVFVVSARPLGPKVGRGSIQDFDSAFLLRGATKQSEQLIHTKQIPHLTRDLLATALAPNPGPVNLTCTCDQW